MVIRKDIRIIISAFLVISLLLLTIYLLLPIPHFNFEPIWSRDGKKIAYICYDFSFRNFVNNELFFDRANRDIPYDPVYSDICMISSDGTNEIHITNDQGENYDPQWSPDNDYVAYISIKENGESFINYWSLNNSIVQSLKYTSGVFDYIWMPNGKQILFASHLDYVDRIILLDVFSNEETIIKENSNLSSLGYSPYKNLISYVQRAGDSCRIHLLSLQDRADAIIPYNIACSISPSWSMDGTKLAFEDLQKKLIIYYLDSEIYNEILVPYDPILFSLTWHSENKIMGFSGGNIIQYDVENNQWKILLSSEKNFEINPLGQKMISVSPNGKFIANTRISKNGKNANIWIDNLDGSGSFKLTN